MNLKKTIAELFFINIIQTHLNKVTLLYQSNTNNINDDTKKICVFMADRLESYKLKSTTLSALNSCLSCISVIYFLVHHQ